MKVNGWAVSANWGIYNHIVRTDCATKREAIEIAVRYRQRYEKMRRMRRGHLRGRLPIVSIWQHYDTI